MGDFTFIEIGTFSIALIALIQPWVLYIWKKYFKPGRIEFYHTGNLEVGYSNLGSTVAVNGTLRAINSGFFIQEMEIQIRKLKDSSIHDFRWAVFRDTRVHLSSTSQGIVELPYGFYLTTDSPHRVNIQFHDLKQQDEIRPTIAQLNKGWREFLNEHYPFEESAKDDDVSYNLKKHNIFRKFTGANYHLDAYAKFGREFYWEKGKYELSLVIKTSSPSKKFKKEWSFDLMEEDESLLGLNSINIVDHASDQTVNYWNFAYPKYVKDNSTG